MKKQLIAAALLLSVFAVDVFAQAATINASEFTTATNRSDFAPSTWCARATMTAASNTIVITATTVPASPTGIWVASAMAMTSATTGILVPVTSTAIAGFSGVLVNAPSTNVVNVCGGYRY